MTVVSFVILVDLMISKSVETERSLSFSSDFVRGVHARGHLRVSRVLLDGLRRKRDCS